MYVVRDVKNVVLIVDVFLSEDLIDRWIWKDGYELISINSSVYIICIVRVFNV